MNRVNRSFLITALLCTSVIGAEDILFRDDFADGLDKGWTWVREDRTAWRVRAGALEMHVLPGNLWGRSNDAKNILLRAAPDAAAGPVEISVSIANKPTHQYEQANLSWYYDDSHMVKLGLELVDGKACLVMGREESDRTKTLAKIPIETSAVRVRLLVNGDRIQGQYRLDDAADWIAAGEGVLPAPPDGQAKISLHCYQGEPGTMHWARFTGFCVRRAGR